MRTTTENDGLIFNSPGSQLDLLIMGLSHEPTKKQIQKEAKTSNKFT